MKCIPYNKKERDDILIIFVFSIVSTVSQIFTKIHQYFIWGLGIKKEAFSCKKHAIANGQTTHLVV